jgi:hypothetical protein
VIGTDRSTRADAGSAKPRPLVSVSCPPATVCTTPSTRSAGAGLGEAAAAAGEAAGEPTGDATAAAVGAAAGGAAEGVGEDAVGVGPHAVPTNAMTLRKAVSLLFRTV